MDAAIKQFGGVIDMPFPVIDPHASLNTVQILAEKTFEMIKSMKIYDLRIHIMGEFTFSYNLIKHFQENKIPCFASTTVRNAIMNPDGTKTSAFEFLNFRPYY